MYCCWLTLDNICTSQLLNDPRCAETESINVGGHVPCWLFSFFCRQDKTTSKRIVFSNVDGNLVHSEGLLDSHLALVSMGNQ